MASIEGRVSEYGAVYDKKSKKIIPFSMRSMRVMLYTLPVEQFRIIQDTIDHVTVKFVRTKNYTEDNTEHLLEYMRSNYGDNLEIDVEFVDDIPPLPSGKRSSFISKVNPFTYLQTGEKVQS
jgi:hypothetical protein